MNYLRELWIFVPALWAMSSQADVPQLEPARLENAAEVARLISFPDTAMAGDLIIIRCGTNISREGTASPVLYTNLAHSALFKPYEKEVRKVIDRLRVVPARVDNRAVPVWFSFSVIFDNMQGTKQVKIVANLQYDAKRYGEQYVDPQRIDRRAFPAACAWRSPVWTVAKTDARGTAVSASLIEGTTSKGCERALINLLLESKFIPAQHDGKAVEGTYVEAWYTDS